MLSLHEAQHAIATTLSHGPQHCPDGLFAGSEAHVLRGLKVHANTVSHARLIALEESFPHCRAAIGEQAFNTASRNWLDAGHGRGCALAEIGRDFPDWLEQDADLRHCAVLARFEWAWLEAYHAAEAEPLSATALQAMAPDALLTIAISAHPAVRVVAHDALIADLLGLAASESQLLIVRPDAEVTMHLLPAAWASLLSLFNGQTPLAAVLETFWDVWPNEDAVAGMGWLVSVGALTLEIAPC